MFKEFVRGKTIVCIDAANVYFSQRRLGWKIDFQELIKILRAELDVFEVYYYTGYDPSNNQQRKFLDKLEILGFQIRKKIIKFIKEKNKIVYLKANLDVELTIDLLRFMGEYQSVILFSGDSDFEPLIKYLKQYEKRCIVVSTKGHIAFELLREAKFVDIKKLRSNIELKNKSSTP